MSKEIDLAIDAEKHLIRRINERISTNSSVDRINYLKELLALTQRFIAGERGEIGKIINGDFHWSWVDEGPEANSSVSQFAFAAEDACNGMARNP